MWCNRYACIFSELHRYWVFLGHFDLTLQNFIATRFFLITAYSVFLCADENAWSVCSDSECACWVGPGQLVSANALCVIIILKIIAMKLDSLSRHIYIWKYAWNVSWCGRFQAQNPLVLHTKLRNCCVGQANVQSKKGWQVTGNVAKHGQVCKSS